MEQKKKRTQKKEIVKETRDLNLTFVKSGAGNITPRVSLPITWIKHMGMNLDEREIEVTYSPRTKKITIRKKGSNVSEKEEVGE
ncbi:hypothetical protein [Cetobacterium sp.]|uniref:hypothetical protein n=1 Tax=Cetobacterium sp. TaxID=2071632 RepID=UPI00262E62EA|nr:hypothetical protein [uncultured Cetobacterium sp.]